MIDRITYLLILIRDLCMPQTVIETPGRGDYVIILLAFCSVLGAFIWFVWALATRDGPEIDVIKARVIED